MAYGAVANVQHAEKRVFTVFHHQVWKSILETEIKQMRYSQIINMPKNAIWLCFHNQLLKSALETQRKAYAVFA